MTDSPRDEVTLTESSSVGVSGSASDETRAAGQDLAGGEEVGLDTSRADWRDRDPDRLRRSMPALSDALARWVVDTSQREWLTEARAALAALTEALESFESRVVGLSADVSRLDYLRGLALNRARRSERECNELERRAGAAEARVAVLREALDWYRDNKRADGSYDGELFGDLNEREASLRDAGEATG